MEMTKLVKRKEKEREKEGPLLSPFLFHPLHPSKRASLAQNQANKQAPDPLVRDPVEEDSEDDPA